MKPQCTTAAQCLKELARVMEQFGISSIYEAIHTKFILHRGFCYDKGIKWAGIPEFNDPEKWQFAIAEVEGKPVFIGDELYDDPGLRMIVVSFEHGMFTVEIGNTWSCRETLYWNPPKPKTVMVELPLYIVAHYAKYFTDNGVGEACKLALEKLNETNTRTD